jgi:hypothetical protein
MDHQFMARKREKVVDGGNYSGDVVGASVVKSIASRGCRDVEELVPIGGGIWSTMMGQFVVVLDG